MKKINVNDLRSLNNFSMFMKYLKQRKGFSFLRLGDGEWGLMLRRNPVYGVISKRWDGSYLIEEAIPRLNKIVESKPTYYLGIQPHAFGLFTEDIIQKVPDGCNYCNSDIFHSKSQAGELDEFFKILKDRNVIVVGKKYLSGLSSRFRFKHIISPEDYWRKANWNFLERMQRQIEEQIREMPNPVILYSSGIAGKFILHRLYKKYGKSITQIDTGSLFEPYVGLNIRSYHKKVIQNLKK